jgi:hypothetical protein
MSVQKKHYESWLAEYSHVESVLGLLREYRPYMEKIPSLRRLDESVIAIPFPLVRLRAAISQKGLNGLDLGAGETLCLPCEIGILMCDPDWKIKTGIEVFIFVHRPQEDFSDLFLRWRQTQVLLDRGYEWVMPYRYRHMFCEGSDRVFPLFVLFEETPERIKRGLKGAGLPFVVRVPEDAKNDTQTETPLSAESSSP